MSALRKTRVYVAGKMRGLPLFNFPAFDAARDRLSGLGFDVVSPADIDRACGFDAMTLPSDTDWNVIPPGLDEEEIMIRDIDALDTCDAIYVMTAGVGTSTGAKKEIEHAKRTGKLFMFDTWDDEALNCCAVTVDDERTYGGGPPVGWTEEAIGDLGIVTVAEASGGERIEVQELAPAAEDTVEISDCYTERGGVLDEAKKLICGDRNATYGPPNQDFQRTADMMTALFGWMLKDGCRFKARDVAWMMIFVKASRSQHSPKRDNYVDAAGYAACGWECEASEGKA